MPLPEINPDDWDAVREAFSKTAAAINSQRRRLAALEAQVQALCEQIEQAGASAGTASPGVFVPSPACCMCGQPKEAGRAALTCAPCGRAYQAGIKGEGKRITFDTCVNCRETKPSSTKMLCSQCGPAFRMWKAGR